MRTVQVVEEKAVEGLALLLGSPVEIWALTYIYAGILVGVNDTCIKLSNPHIVYETGPFSDPKYKKVEHMKREFHYIQTAAIEGFSQGNRL